MSPYLWSRRAAESLQGPCFLGLPGEGPGLGNWALPGSVPRRTRGPGTLRECPVLQRACSPAPAPGWWCWPCSSLSWSSLQPSVLCSCLPGKTKVSGDRPKDYCGRFARKSGVDEGQSSELKLRKNNMNRKQNSPSPSGLRLSQMTGFLVEAATSSWEVCVCLWDCFQIRHLNSCIQKLEPPMDVCVCLFVYLSVSPSKDGQRLWCFLLAEPLSQL